MAMSKRSTRCPAIAYTAWMSILLIISVNSQMAAASPLIVLSSSLSEGQRVCPGDAITFTCVTNGSAILAWNSDDYIGQGGVQLEFPSHRNPGRIERNPASPIGTQAVLISKEIEENETQGILESQLNIIVTSDYPNPTINCLHVDTGNQEATSFKLLDEPGAPQGVEVFEIPDNRNSRGSCILTLQLNHPSNVGPSEVPHLTYLIDYQSRQDMITGTSYTFIVQNCTPEFRINITAVNRCGNIGGSVVDVVPVFLPESVSVAQGPNVGLAVSLSVLALFVVVGISFVVGFLIYKYCCKKGGRPEGGDEQPLHPIQPTPHGILPGPIDITSDKLIKEIKEALINDVEFKEFLKDLIKESSEE